MPARKVEDAIAPYRADLGKVADAAIATKAGVSRSVVVNYRKKLGIPAYEGYKFGARDDKAAAPAAAKSTKTSRGAPAEAPSRRKPGRPPKVKPAEDTAAAPQGKVFRGRKSKLDAFADMLGKVPDSEIARMADVTQENVRTYRMRRGIEGPRPVVTEAPAKAPVADTGDTSSKAAAAPKASAPSAGLVFSVQIETEKGVRTYAVVAKDIAEAAKTALGRAAAKHGKATIKSLQYVAELL